MQSIANSLIEAGLCPLPCKMPEKRPAVPSWTKYQKERPQPGEHNYYDGIGLVTGLISNLIVIDLDIKYDISGTLWQRFKEAVHLWESIERKAYIQKTINNGYHVFIRCEEIGGNKKIASRLATLEELAKNPGEKAKCIIETRENGGFIVIAPTPGYQPVSGSLTNLELLTRDEYNDLITACYSFNEVHEKVIEKTADGLKPWDDYNARVSGPDILDRNGWTFLRQVGRNKHYCRPGKTGATSGTWADDINLFYCFTSSTPLQPGKAYTPSALFTWLECAGDFSAAAKRMYADGFGDRGKKQLPARADNGNEEPEFYRFGKNGIVISATLFLRMVSLKGGFYLYYPNDNRAMYRMIKITDGFVEEATTEMIKKFVTDYINSTCDEPDRVLEALHGSSDKLFSKGSLEFLQSIDLNLLTHTAKTAYYPFLNGVVCVEPEKEIRLIPYSEIKMHVWRDHVINHNFVYLPDDWNNSEFLTFVAMICDKNEARFMVACSIIGYLLHDYKDPAKPYAIILAEEVENEDNGGGTGKGIFFRAISKIVKTLVVDGKSFKHDKPFLFQRVDLSTQMIVVDDCRKNIDFQGFYSHISEGLTVEKKNRDEIHIPYAKSPKFVFSTNYTINLDGQHGKRRAKIVEFSNFFSASNTPIDYFGHLLFDGWNELEWNRFYSAMMHCVHDYLVTSIPSINDSVSISRKEIIIRFTKEFMEFWDSMDKNDPIMLSDLYSFFLSSNEIDK